MGVISFPGLSHTRKAGHEAMQVGSRTGLKTWLLHVHFFLFRLVAGDS